jgi:hypothetical protein
VTGPWRGEGLRILDFDTENRPLAYLGGDFTTGEITAIAWQFIGEPRTFDFALLGFSCQHEQLIERGSRVGVARYETCGQYHNGESYEDMLARFVQAYDEADMVTGHFIRGYDLPVINGALLEMGRAPLSDKLVHDTKQDLVTRKYLSASQENLAETLGVRASKVKMNNAKWRGANRLSPEGLELTRKRVVGDIRQHIQLRARLMEIGALRPPRMWSGKATASVRYSP